MASTVYETEISGGVVQKSSIRKLPIFADVSGTLPKFAH